MSNQNIGNDPTPPGVQQGGYASVMYSRPPDSINAMFALIDENRNGNNEGIEDDRFMRLMLNRISGGGNSISDEAEDNSNTPPPPPWSIHSPEIRSVFHDLKTKLKDIEMIYNGPDDCTTEGHCPPTSETIENTKKLEECVAYFKQKIEANFDKYVEYQTQCEKEETFLTQCKSLLETIQTPNADLNEKDFSDCASSICDSLVTFTDKLQTNVSENRKNRSMYWNIYKDLRDRCKLLKVVQSDLICQICLANEIDMVLNCGHCFCSTCATRNNSCPNCRTMTTQKIKMFF
tara:strand:+ start:1339 stop:2208 length:870 start_codon:yes stop_codon:yes gene_type:complete